MILVDACRRSMASSVNIIMPNYILINKDDLMILLDVNYKNQYERYLILNKYQITTSNINTDISNIVSSLPENINFSKY